MPKFQITADPDQEVGVAIGQSFIAFEGVHDVATSQITKKRRYIINLSPDDILWTIEALAKELPEVLHEEAVARIEQLTSTHESVGMMQTQDAAPGVQWYKRVDMPRVPGLWVVVFSAGAGMPRRESHRMIADTYNTDDIDRGAPFQCEWVYGPIPERSTV